MRATQRKASDRSQRGLPRRKAQERMWVEEELVQRVYGLKVSIFFSNDLIFGWRYWASNTEVCSLPQPCRHVAEKSQRAWCSSMDDLTHEEVGGVVLARILGLGQGILFGLARLGWCGISSVVKNNNSCDGG